MMHQATLYDEAKHPDPHAFADALSRSISEDIHKAMALVLWDGEPVAFVYCDTTLWAAITGCYEGLPFGEQHTFSIAWLPFGHLGPDSVWSLCFDTSLWHACCTEPEKMRIYFDIVFGTDEERNGND